jgi:hypothetical protein
LSGTIHERLLHLAHFRHYISPDAVIFKQHKFGHKFGQFSFSHSLSDACGSPKATAMNTEAKATNFKADIFDGKIELLRIFEFNNLSKFLSGDDGYL